jgi:hypothetical protein
MDNVMPRELSKAVTTQTYANAFYVVSPTCAGGVLLGLTMRSGKVRHSGVKAPPRAVRGRAVS